MSASQTADTIAVVVPTYNRRDRLPRMVAALSQAQDLDEIVIVVDGSRDGSIELLEELAVHRAAPAAAVDRERRPDRGADRRGRGGDRGRGRQHRRRRHSRARHVPGHLRHHRDQPGLVVAGYAYMPPEPWRPGGFIREAFRRNYEAQCERWERDPTTVLTELWTPNVSFRRVDLLRVGADDQRGFGGAAFFYHSDWDLGLRCRRARACKGCSIAACAPTTSSSAPSPGSSPTPAAPATGRCWSSGCIPELGVRAASNGGAGAGARAAGARAPVRSARAPRSRRRSTGALKLAGRRRVRRAPRCGSPGVLKRVEEERGPDSRQSGRPTRSDRPAAKLLRRDTA